MMIPSTASANFADNALQDANIPAGPMAELARGRRNGVLDAFATRTLAGLGNDAGCPDNAPFAVPGWPGRCSNVQTLPDSNLFPTDNPVTAYAGAPVTNTSITQQNDEARFGLQLTADRATQEQLAAEAQSQGAAQGYSVSCRIIENTAPAYGGLPADVKYQAICTVNGQDGHSAALLIRPGGWDLVRTEAHLPPSTYLPPVAQTPATTTTSTQASHQSGGGNTTVQSTGGTGQSNTPNASGTQTQQWPIGMYDPGFATPTPSLSGILSNPIVLVGLAGLAFMMSRGGKH